MIKFARICVPVMVLFAIVFFGACDRCQGAESAGTSVHTESTLIPLTIDPLLASTFLGGTGKDGLFEVPMKLDVEGNVYVASRTQSVDLPVTAGAYQGAHAGGNDDIFIAKFSPGLTELLACTYIGGRFVDGEWPGVALELDESGNVYVAGKTISDDFPTTSGAYMETIQGGWDAFVVKFSPDLSTLIASTYLGGSANEYYLGLAHDGAGGIFVTGTTASSDFPVTAGALDMSYNGYGGGPYGGDIFVASLTDDLTTLQASTFLGGSTVEYVEAVQLDSDGNVVMAGWTGSANFPTTAGAVRTTYGGGYYDAYVAKVSSDLSSLMGSTFLGGSLWDFAYGMALDGDDNVYVTGHTASSNYPTTAGAYDETYGGGAQGSGDDSFVTKLNHDFTSMLASTYLGGSAWENGYDIEIDGDGSVFVTGQTRSVDFPVTSTSLYPDHNGGNDIFVSRFDSELISMSYGTFVGGSVNEEVGSMELDADGNLLLAGITNSDNYPATAGAFDETYNGGGEVWSGENIGGDVYVSVIPKEQWMDMDSDGVMDTEDNCPEAYNPGQEDNDENGSGNACCCGEYASGYTGNANGSVDGKLTLSDITRLIDHVYISKSELGCPANGNTNGSEDGRVTLSDITALIDNVYISKSPTASCP